MQSSPEQLIGYTPHYITWRLYCVPQQKTNLKIKWNFNYLHVLPKMQGTIFVEKIELRFS